jgi:hypothetical protein
VGGSNIFAIRLQPLLWAGLTAARVKIPISGGGIRNNLHFTVSFIIYLIDKCGCLSVRSSAWNNSDPTGRIFIQIDIYVFLEKSVEKICVSLKYKKNKAYFIRRQIYSYIFIKSLSVHLGIRNVSDKSYIENQNACFTSYIQQLFFENRALDEVMWKNIVKPGR